MIELRWVIREEANPLRIKVLQYREGSYPYDDPKYKNEWVGSEWIDVPTVTDSTV